VGVAVGVGVGVGVAVGVGVGVGDGNDEVCCMTPLTDKVTFFSTCPAEKFVNNSPMHIANAVSTQILLFMS